MQTRLRGVSVRYEQGHALRDVDLSVAEGERVALLGPSGAGKTTLLRVLAGMVQADAGSVEVLGQDIGRLRGRKLRSHRSRVGVITQGLDMALSLRVVHNVNAGRLGGWSAAAALWSLVRPLGRGKVVSALEEVGLASRLDARTDELSGGERQRVAVARVLLQRPSLVLADEPTSSVDPELADHVMGLLCGPDRPTSWTTVVSVHDPALARRHATRLVGLRSGSVIFDSPAGDVGPADLAALYGAGR